MVTLGPLILERLGSMVIVHLATGQHELGRMSDDEWRFIEVVGKGHASMFAEVKRLDDEVTRARDAIAAMRVCIVYARDRRGGAFDFDTWTRLVETALEKGQLPPHAIEEAQAETLIYRTALDNVRKERDALTREVEDLRRRQQAWIEATSG